MEKTDAETKKEVDSITREMNQMFIEDISKGRKIYLGLFLLLLPVIRQQ